MVHGGGARWAWRGREDEGEGRGEGGSMYRIGGKDEGHTRVDRRI